MGATATPLKTLSVWNKPCTKSSCLARTTGHCPQLQLPPSRPVRGYPPHASTKNKQLRFGALLKWIVPTLPHTLDSLTAVKMTSVGPMFFVIGVGRREPKFPIQRSPRCLGLVFPGPAPERKFTTYAANPYEGSAAVIPRQKLAA